MYAIVIEVKERLSDGGELLLCPYVGNLLLYGGSQGDTDSSEIQYMSIVGLRSCYVP